MFTVVVFFYNLFFVFAYINCGICVSFNRNVQQEADILVVSHENEDHTKKSKLVLADLQTEIGKLLK